MIISEHHPYSPDLTPCNFYLFPKARSVLKGTHFLQNCFEHWKARMLRCIDKRGKYIEGDTSQLTMSYLIATLINHYTFHRSHSYFPPIRNSAFCLSDCLIIFLYFICFTYTQLQYQEFGHFIFFAFNISRNS